MSNIANYFVDQIGKLYLIEMYNKIEGLSHNEIYRRRKTESISILNEMKRKAEDFLKTDGGVASEKSAEIAAFFYSIMATCKMRGMNARDYVAGFFKALNAVRTDYAQMLPGLL